jgi:hypothetical protein
MAEFDTKAHSFCKQTIEQLCIDPTQGKNSRIDIGAALPMTMTDASPATDTIAYSTF